MNHAGEVASGGARRPVPLSRRVVKASRLHELLHYLAGGASRVMGNQQAAGAPGPTARRQERRASLPCIKSFQWSCGPQATILRDGPPPEYLMKLAKVITSKFRGGDLCSCACDRLYIPLSFVNCVPGCGATRTTTLNTHTLAYTGMALERNTTKH